MRQQAINYAKALFALTTDKETVDVLGTLPGKIPSFIRVLSDPLLSGVKKGEIIDDISKKVRRITSCGRRLFLRKNLKKKKWIRQYIFWKRHIRAETSGPQCPCRRNFWAVSASASGIRNMTGVMKTGSVSLQES